MKDYVQLALRTESTQWHEPNHRLLHAAMGLVTETAEFAASTDDKNYVEEMGDILWYVAIACDVLEISLDEAEESVLDFDPSPWGDNLIFCAAEILDMLKKSIFYGKPICLQKVAEQLGRILILITIEGDTPLDEVMAANIFKLEKRFPELKFSQERALDRDVENEMNHF